MNNISKRRKKEQNTARERGGRKRSTIHKHRHLRKANEREKERKRKKKRLPSHTLTTQTK